LLKVCVNKALLIKYALITKISITNRFMFKILSEEIPYQTNSEQLFECLRDLPEAIWLDSGKPRSLQGRFDIISAYPQAIIETNSEQSYLLQDNHRSETKQNPFDIATNLLSEIQPIDKPQDAPFVCGLLGYFGYDFGRQSESIQSIKPCATELPDLRLGLYLWSLVIDHELRKNTLHFHPSFPLDLQQEIRSRLIEKPEIADTGFVLKETFKATVSKDRYIEAISQVKQYITEGDCYQVNYAQHLCAPFEGDLWQAYKRLRNANPAPYSAFWQWQDQAILSLSPERFIQAYPENKIIKAQTKPIKGTVLRGKTVEEDQENAIQLLNSDKDRAENLMIVDLLRNDLGKSCIAGSIRVPKLFDLESFPNVHHLVSTVTGDLKPDYSPLDLLRGCFPGGSITGAPKKRSMEIIDELEPIQRSVYCGSIGYLCASNQMDTNIAIRTVIAEDSTVHCWGGGGIVADSDANSEFEESMNKIRLMLETLEETID
jgi:para-aminobenzoate synthetase component 1